MPFLHNHKKKLSPWKIAEKLTYKTGFRHTIFNSVGDAYIGEWNNDKKEGKGSCYQRFGFLYEGDWERGYRHGHGTLTSKQPDKTYAFIYQGDWKNGWPDGYGTRYYPDCSLYIGEWKRGKRSGFGRMWYIDGSYYEGYWKNDVFDGLGMFVQVNGNRYEGSFKAGFKHGHGKFFHLDTGQLQEGFWVTDTAKCTTVRDIFYRQTALLSSKDSLTPICLLDTENVIRTEHELLAQI